MKPADICYKPRLILFIDILGFREIVAKTSTNAAVLQTLLAAIDVISELSSEDPDEGKQVSQFSDSIVVSYELNKRSAVFHLINDVALTVIELASQGFLLRGAITAGDLIHTERYLVGPAMVRAYEMESKEAVYPRVLIDPIILEIAKRHRSPDHSPEDEAEYVRGFMSTDPTDGKYYYDYVSFNSVIAVAGADVDLYDAYLKRLGQTIERGLAHSSKEVCKKHLWLHRQYVAAIDALVDEPVDSTFRDENLGLCEAAERLPRLENFADAARRRIDSNGSGSDCAG